MEFMNTTMCPSTKSPPLRAFRVGITQSKRSTPQATALGSSHFIHCLVELRGDVKAIQDVESMAHVGGDDLQVGLPHVAANDLDVLAALPAQVAEDLEVFDVHGGKVYDY